MSGARSESGAGLSETALRLKAEQRLLEAIEKGSVDGAREALARGASPRARWVGPWRFGKAGGDGMSALERALFRGEMEIVKLLLDAERRLTQRRLAWGEEDEEPVSRRGAWMMALFSTRPKSALEALLSELGPEGVDDPRARKAILHTVTTAARQGCEKGLDILLSAGASPEGSPDGTSALLWAARSGFEGCVKRLIEAGADPEAPDEDGDRPLAILASRGDAEGVRILLRWCDPLATGFQSRSALLWAAREGNFECVQRLAPVSDVLATAGGETAVMMARRSGCERTLDLLAEMERAEVERRELASLVKEGDAAGKRPGL